MSTDQPRLSVVIPVYNEAENILRTLGQVDQHAPPGTIVHIVYDFPEDTTLSVLPQFQGQNIEVRAVQNTFGKGVINALKFGLSQPVGDCCLVVMGDMSDDLAALKPMIDEMRRGAVVVCGSRYMRGGRQIGGPFLKGFLARMAGLSLRWLVNFPTYDPSNSFKLYARSFLDSTTIESTAGFAVGIELTVKAWVAGHKVSEVPSTWRDRSAGESRFRLWAWLPVYLHWYFMALRHGFRRRFLGQAAQ